MYFDIIETEKLGSNWAQQFVVARKKTVYLRIVGDGTDYRVMTATASEDAGGYHICQDKERLWEAAAQLARNHDCTEEADKDGKGRVYIKVFTVSQPKDVSDEIFTKDITDLIDEFFTIYDASGNEGKTQKPTT